MKTRLSICLYVYMAGMLLSGTVSAQSLAGYYIDSLYGTSSGFQPSQIPWSKYAYIIHFAASVNAQGTITPPGDTAALMSSRPAGKKVLLSIVQSSSGLFLNATSSANIGSFVSSIANYVINNGYDGVDLDWEGDPNQGQYESLIEQLYSALPGRIITLAVYPDSNLIGTAVTESTAQPSKLTQVDVMCYDEDYLSSVSWYVHNTTANGTGNPGCDATVASFTGPGKVPNNLIGIGIPFYGRRWPNITQVLASVSPSCQPDNSTCSTILYRDLVSDSTRWQPQYQFFDTIYKSEYLSINNGSLIEFTSYTGPQTIAATVNWGEQQGYAGFFTFALNYEFLSTQSEDAAYPLSTALYNASFPGSSGTDPYSYWKLDDGSGVVATDSSSTPHNLTLLNAPEWQSGASCKLGSCLSFNGASQAGSVALDLSDTDVVTVTFWLKWNAFADNDQLAMEFTPDFNNATTGFMIDPNSSQHPGNIEAGVRGDAGYNQINFPRPTAGVWHHYAFIFDKRSSAGSNEVTAYVDGVLVNASQQTTALNSNNFGSNTLYLMSWAASSLFGAGSMDNIQIYKQALSGVQIASIYENAAYANWKFDDGVGTTAVDATNNGHTATLANGPVWQSGGSCEVDGCIRFNGSNQSASAALDLSDTKVVTVTFWLNWDNFADNDQLALEFSANFNNVTTGFMIDPNSSQHPGNIEAGVFGDAGYNQVYFARPGAGSWHHYAFVFDKSAPAATQVTPYVDGSAVSYVKQTNAVNTNNFASDMLYFMSRDGSSLFGAGALDEVRIYKRALNSSEVFTTYRSH